MGLRRPYCRSCGASCSLFWNIWCQSTIGGPHVCICSMPSLHAHSCVRVRTCTSTHEYSSPHPPSALPASCLSAPPRHRHLPSELQFLRHVNMRTRKHIEHLRRPSCVCVSVSVSVSVSMGYGVGGSGVWDGGRLVALEVQFLQHAAPQRLYSQRLPTCACVRASFCAPKDVRAHT